MRLRVLSNFTVEPLVEVLKPVDVTLGDFTSLPLELINPHSAAAGPEVSHVLCIFETNSLLRGALPLAEAEQAGIFLDALQDFCVRHPEKVVVAHTFCAQAARVLTFNDVLSQNGSLRGAEDRLNARLVEMGRATANLLVLDLEVLFRRYGEEQLSAPALWYAGRIPYKALFFRAFAEYLKQGLAAFSNRARKVLILDLDNTLWGGVVGELGAAGIVLSAEGPGAIYRDFQFAIKGLKETGVLLAIASKNNLSDINEVFATNSMMVLQPSDFACMRINWKPKPDNIADITATLGIGADSCVLIDDNPAERGVVAAALPDVVVPGFPERLDTLPQWFVEKVARPYFGRYRITAEDVGKTEQYQAREARKQFAEGFSFDGFLDQLGIVCTFRVDDPETVQRASQLTMKTNQFNLATRRCDVPEVESYVRDPSRALVVLEYADRFGAEGNVGLAMLDFERASIDNFMLSCRVIGRKVEDVLLDKCIELFREHRVEKVDAEYVATAKNGVAASFYGAHGFEPISTEGESTMYRFIINGQR